MNTLKGYSGKLISVLVVILVMSLSIWIGMLIVMAYSKNSQLVCSKEVVVKEITMVDYRTVYIVTDNNEQVMLSLPSNLRIGSTVCINYIRGK